MHQPRLSCPRWRVPGTRIQILTLPALQGRDFRNTSSSGPGLEAGSLLWGTSAHERLQGAVGCFLPGQGPVWSPGNDLTGSKADRRKKTFEHCPFSCETFLLSWPFSHCQTQGTWRAVGGRPCRTTHFCGKQGCREV